MENKNRKAIEYINNALNSMDEYAVDPPIIRDNLQNALVELKHNKEDCWSNNQKCDCGQNSVCNLFQKDGSYIYFCWSCFFKYEGNNGIS